jgi:Ser/Thr protein kinase RdoA (MazF antagonist)
VSYLECLTLDILADMPVSQAEFALCAMQQIGARATSAHEIVGLGSVNHVFVVSSDSHEKWVVRFCRNPLDNGNYKEESWCLNAAFRHGVAVPQFVAIGKLDGIQFIVQEFVAGENANIRRSPELWRTLGSYSRIVNGIQLDSSAPEGLFGRFGRDPRLSWLSHVEYNLAQLTEDDPLIVHEVYDRSQQPLIRSLIEGLREQVEQFGLSHGDLVPRNVLLPPGGKPTLIDWGSASVGPVPFHDYMRIWADEAEGFSPADLEAFAQGYGVPLRQLHSTLVDMNILSHIDLVRWARDRRPDRLPEITAKSRRVVHQLLQVRRP